MGLKFDSSRGSRGGRGRASNRGSSRGRGSSSRGGAKGTSRVGDWKCSDASCGNMNFAYRTECNRCQVPRSNASAAGGSGSQPAENQGGSSKRVFSKSDRGTKTSTAGRGAGKVGKGNHPTFDKKMNEITCGLKLLVVYKNGTSVEKMEKTLDGFHSKISKHNKKDSGIVNILLFTSIESLEAAKVKLDNDNNVESTEYLGRRNARNQPTFCECRQLFLKFSQPIDVKKVKELDSSIEEVSIMEDKQSCVVEYSTYEKAVVAQKLLKGKIGTNGLAGVNGSRRMRYYAAIKSGIMGKKVVLRDVPKCTTLNDIAPLFPDANTFVMYTDTFPDSKYCHASLSFTNAKRVFKVLEMGSLELLGKKIYAVPAHQSLMADFPWLGQHEPEGDNKVVINKVKVKAPEASVGKEEPEEDSEDPEAEEEGDIDFGDDGQGSSDELEYEEDE